MKRTLALLLTAVMLLALAACGQKTDDGSGTPAPAPDSGSSTQTPSDSQQPSNAEVTNVVYGFPGTAARLNFVNDDGTYDGYEIAIIQELDKRLEQYTFELYCAG